jgi:hypothetical protein
MRYRKAGVFMAYLKLLNPEILRVVNTVELTYLEEAIVLSLMPKER